MIRFYQVPGTGGYQLSIFLGPLSVHVLRQAPDWFMVSVIDGVKVQWKKATKSWTFSRTPTLDVSRLLLASA